MCSTCLSTEQIVTISKNVRMNLKKVSQEISLLFLFLLSSYHDRHTLCFGQQTCPLRETILPICKFRLVFTILSFWLKISVTRLKNFCNDRNMIFFQKNFICRARHYFTVKLVPTDISANFQWSMSRKVFRKLHVIISDLSLTREAWC